MTQPTPPKYRHELKYLVTDAQIAELKNRVNGLLPPDPHAADGHYTVSSLYFDNWQNRCYYENENGTDPREKFRIRIYNRDASRITLECKRKEKGMTLKTSCPLTLEQAQKLAAGQILPDIAGQPPVLRKLTLAMMTERMRPVVIVEYDRIPYVYAMGNVRVTLDTHLSSSTAAGGFLSQTPLPKRPVMPLGKQLLEVKYDEFLPDAVYRALQLDSLRQTAFSKYYLCRKYSL